MRAIIFLTLLSLSFFDQSVLHATEESCAPVLSSDNTLSEAQRVVAESEWRRAIDQDKVEDIKRLLSKVDVNITNDKGKTALMAAVKVGDHCLFQELLQRGLKITDRGYTGGTALMYAVLGNQSAMIDLILSNKTDVNAQSTNGWTAVMIAAAKGFDSAISALHEAGADLDLADVYGWTPLMRAIDNRHSGVVEYLLSQPDIDLHRTNENGSIALHIAVQTGNGSAVSRLLQLGSPTDVRDKNGYTAAGIAKKNNQVDIAREILQSEK